MSSPPQHCLLSPQPGLVLQAGTVGSGTGRGLIAHASVLRIFIIWAISSWFRRGPSPQDQSGPGGAPRVASRNLFPKDTLMVMVGGRRAEGWGSAVRTGGVGPCPLCQLCRLGARCSGPSEPPQGHRGNRALGSSCSRLPGCWVPIATGSPGAFFQKHVWLCSCG